MNPAPPANSNHTFPTLAAAWRHFSHVLDNGAAEFAALDFLGTLHETREIVSDRFRGDRPVHALDDQVGRFRPTHVPEHHFP